jgi:hypothetical protein
MDFNGKKTERVLMRVSEDMAREVRALAELECRPIQDQCRLLIMIGLSHAKANVGNGMNMRVRQAVSTAETLSTQSTRSTFSDESAKAVPSTDGKPRQLLLGGTVGPIPARKRKVG